MSVVDTVVSGSLLVAAPLAFTAGVVSFRTYPCAPMRTLSRTISRSS